ncbi:MAG: glycosyltransferase family 39 protein [Anaerolineae bacterium]|nr:glycosyltransferase family 39 protein [Anaerolineae bacterium]
MRNKLLILLGFHACWGLLLALSISNYGLGVSTDATSYMFTGMNWILGNGLVDFSGGEYILWPPLYPMLIGFLHALGLSPFAAAHVIQFFAFAMVAYFSSAILLKLFRDDFAFAFLGAFLIATGPIVVSTFYMVGTDYLFMAFILAAAWLIQRFSEKQDVATLTLIGLTVSLAMLTRYIGYALVLSALLAVLYYSSGSLLKRILRCAYVGVFSLVPFLWMLNTWTATSGNRREPLSFIEYASQFTVGTLAWFTTNIPDTNEATLLHYVIVWVPVLLAFILLFILSKKIQVLNPAATFMIGFGVIYTAALFTNALIAYFNRLWGRFQLPDYFPLVILFLLVIGYGSRYLKEHHSRFYIPAAILGFGFLLFVSAAQLNRTVLLMRDAIQGDIPENGINTGEMNENSIIQYWKANPPQGEYHLFSNYHALAAFHAQHNANASPRKSPIYGDEVYPLEDYIGYLFPDERDVYLLWIEPNAYEHVYLPYEFSPIAEIEVVIENDDGGIYRLRPIR